MPEHLRRLSVDYPAAFWLLLAAVVGLVAVGAVLSVIDARHHRLPDRIVLPAVAAALVLLVTAGLAGGNPAAAARTVLGAAVLFTGFLLLRWVHPAGLGFGDVKLALLLGLYLGYAGWGHLLWGVFAGFLLGGLWGAGLVLLRLGTLRTRIAFGPFLLGGTLAALVLVPG
jgi:leader peptidase (prepilin peptidase) / N-methyltransferase